jgi:serine/threonine protein kinase
MALQPGQVLNSRYRIVRLLGQGGFGAVYRAWDANLNKPCAVKENLDTSPEAQRQFAREATILANLSHPNLPRVTDHFTLPSQGQYLVMDFVEGEDLGSLLQRLGPVPLPQALVWVTQVADALVYLHSRQPPVVHRDIKPANIRITPEGQAMLVDFGLVKVYDPHLRTTMGARAVTPGYAPPEQYGHGATDARTDIYALGATLYHMLTGQEPLESVQRIAGAQMRLAHQVNPNIPVSIGMLIDHSMQLEPAQRFQNAVEFRAALNAAAHGSPQAGLYEQPSPGTASTTVAVSIQPGTQMPASSQAVPWQASSHPVAEPASVQWNTPGTQLVPPGPAASRVPSRPRPSAPVSKPVNRQRIGIGLGGGLVVLILCLVVAVAVGIFYNNDQNRNAQATNNAQVKATLAERVQTTSTAQAKATQSYRAVMTLNAYATQANEIDAKKTAVFGPQSGSLKHDPGDAQVEAMDAKVNLQDFVVQARFSNPFAASKASWDYGFMLRHQGKNNQYRFAIRSDKTWSLSNNSGTPEGEIVASGTLPNLNVDQNGSNLVKLIFKGNQGFFFLNDALVAKFDLSVRMSSGSVWIVTGMFGGDEVAGAETKYSDFNIWSLP